MKVEIECNVKVVGASVEEALARMAEKLMVLQLHDRDREQLAEKYHLWDKHNDGDVDWTPIKFVSQRKNGEIQSQAFLTIRNV